MKRSMFVVYGALAGMTIAGILTALPAKRPYTSTGVIRIAPAVIPERFITSEKIAMDRISSGVLQTILSRGSLSNIIQLYDLYPAERNRRPMEDLIEVMRTAVRADTIDDTTLEVSFSYEDRIAAQKVAAELVSRIMTEHTRFRQMQSMMTLQFMKDSAAEAAAAWESSLTQLKAADTAGKALDRLRLDSEIARRRYETLSAKVAEAEMMRSLEQRQQGASLEVLDAASLPAESQSSIGMWILAGLIAGGVAGWLVGILRAPRRQPDVAEAI
jgi:hypothetical protein